MQIAIMEFFSSIASPALDVIVMAITMLGEETLFILFITYLVWNSSKKRGFAIFSSLALSLIAMGFLKAFIRAPRPFQVLEEIKGKRLETATGYSFPSGHTTGAAAFYSALSLTYRKRIVSLLCAAAILAVGLSRMYLGVHWPIDVFGGLALGITGSTILLPRFEAMWEDRQRLMKFTLLAGAVSTAAAFVLTFLLEAGLADSVGYTDVMKLLILTGSGYLGFHLSERYNPYETKASTGKKWARYGAGVILLLVIQGAKAFLPDTAVVALIRYLLTGLWITFLFPAIGVRTGLFTRS